MLNGTQGRELYEQTQNLYELDDPALHTLSTLGNTLRRDLDSRLYKWKQGGQFGFLFDNAEDTVSFSRFQCLDFQGMREYPQVQLQATYMQIVNAYQLAQRIDRKSTRLNSSHT